MTRDDPELGPVKLCRFCGEDWPFDSTFWHIKDGALDKRWPLRCLACISDYYAARRRKGQEITRANRIIPAPAEGRCNHLMRYGGRCARLAGHARPHRTSIALANNAAAKQRQRRAA